MAKSWSCFEFPAGILAINSNLRRVRSFKHKKLNLNFILISAGSHDSVMLHHLSKRQNCIFPDPLAEGVWQLL